MSDIQFKKYLGPAYEPAKKILKMKPKKNCLAKTRKGKSVFIIGNFKTFTRKKAQKVFNYFKRLSHTDLLKSPSGYYTWIIYTKDNSNTVHFAATEFMNEYEIGTGHHTLGLNSRIGADKVLGGGQIKKNDDGSMVFNLRSGTYTTRRIAALTKRELYEYIDILKTIFKTFFPKTSTRYYSESFEYPSMVIPDSLLTIYSKLGCTIILSKTPQACKRLKEFCKSIGYDKKEINVTDTFMSRVHEYIQEDPQYSLYKHE